MSRNKTKGAFGSSLNNHVLQDLRRRLANNHMIVLSLVHHYKLSQEDVNGMIRQFLQEQGAAQNIFPGTRLPTDSTSDSTSS